MLRSLVGSEMCIRDRGQMVGSPQTNTIWIPDGLLTGITIGKTLGHSLGLTLGTSLSTSPLGTLLSLQKNTHGIIVGNTLGAILGAPLGKSLASPPGLLLGWIPSNKPGGEASDLPNGAPSMAPNVFPTIIPSVFFCNESSVPSGEVLSEVPSVRPSESVSYTHLTLPTKA